MLPEKFIKITTSLKTEEWEVELRELPDRRCTDFLNKGLSEGFTWVLTTEITAARLQKATCNQHSNPRVVQEYLEKEALLGCIVSPINSD